MTKEESERGQLNDVEAQSVLLLLFWSTAQLLYWALSRCLVGSRRVNEAERITSLGTCTPEEGTGRKSGHPPSVLHSNQTEPSETYLTTMGYVALLNFDAVVGVCTTTTKKEQSI